MRPQPSRWFRALLAALVALSACSALFQPAEVLAAGQALTPSPAAGQSVRPLPFHPRDEKAYAAEKQRVAAGNVGRRQGVVAIAPVNRPTPAAPAPLTAQKVAGFPLMTMLQQVALYGTGQALDPPDTQLAVGPTYLAEAVNSTLSIWSRSGSLVSSYDLNVFFTVPSGHHFSDPRILYDAESGRFFLSGFDFDATFSSEVWIAVSTTSDPTGVWSKYPLAIATGVLHDQPMMGVSSDKVVISWNDYSSMLGFTGQETWVLEKSDLVAGAAVPRYSTFGPDMTRFRIVPAQSLTPTTTEWLVYNNSDCAITGCNKNSPTLGVVAITGTPSANNVAWTESDPMIQATNLPAPPQQPGGVPVTRDIYDTLLSAVWQNGTLWAAGNDGCIPEADLRTRSCMKLVKVSTKGATPTVEEDFDGGANGFDYYYPAVTLDGFGNIFVAFSMSSPNVNPSAGAVDLRASSPSRFENVITVAAGQGPHNLSNSTSGRWGDYSGAVPDPVNPAMVWVAAEYQASAGGDAKDWGTAAARMTMQDSALTAVTPQRLLDTRNTGPQLGPAGSLSLTVAGGGSGAPAEASAVVINVTVTNTSEASFVTAYPAGTPRPVSSNLNWFTGQTVANLVQVPVGKGNRVTFYNAAGFTDLIVDLEGYYAAPKDAAGEFQPLPPTRILDTREGNGAPAAKVGPASTLNLRVAGRGGVPINGVSAVVMNVTATNPSAAGFLTVSPAGAPIPFASNLNFSAGETVPNRVIVGVGAAGQVNIYNPSGFTDVVADVGGYFTDASGPGQLFTPLAPLRLLDTRVPTETLGPNGSLDLSMAQARLPSDATAVVLNVTATNTTDASFLTVYPSGDPKPLASDLNWLAQRTVPNLVVVKLGAGSITLFNQFGATDVVVDIFGFFIPPPVSVTANPNSLPANGSTTSALTAVVTLSDGTALANDSVTFTTGGGTSCGTIIGSPAVTSPTGSATATYTASTAAGTCTITATEAINNLSGSVTITQT